MATPQSILDTVRDCFCGLLPVEVLCCASAAEPVVLNCCPGQAWVRIVAIQPAAPTVEYSPCGPFSWKMQLELGLARCAPEDCGDLASCCEAEEEVAAQILLDRATMMRAVSCCTDLPPRDLAYGEWLVDEPSGGCISATLQVFVKFEDSCNCE